MSTIEETRAGFSAEAADVEAKIAAVTASIRARWNAAAAKLAVITIDGAPAFVRGEGGDYILDTCVLQKLERACRWADVRRIEGVVMQHAQMKVDELYSLTDRLDELNRMIDALAAA